MQIFVLIQSDDFPRGSDGKDGKKSACNAGDLASIPGVGISPREGNGYALQYSCLENSTDREAWRATVHGVTKSQTRLRLTLTVMASPLIVTPVTLKTPSLKGRINRNKELPGSQHPSKIS